VEEGEPPHRGGRGAARPPPQPLPSSSTSSSTPAVVIGEPSPPLLSPPLSLRHYTALLYGWCRQGKLNEAKHVLGRMKTADVAPDIVVFNTLLAVFVEMRRKGCTPDSVTYGTLASALEPDHSCLNVANLV
jgi:pentatricopeptide repeat protein